MRTSFKRGIVAFAIGASALSAGGAAIATSAGPARAATVSTTAAVVWSFVLIIVFDYFIVRIAILF